MRATQEPRKESTIGSRPNSGTVRAAAPSDLALELRMLQLECALYRHLSSRYALYNWHNRRREE